MSELGPSNRAQSSCSGSGPKAGGLDHILGRNIMEEAFNDRFRDAIKSTPRLYS